MYIEKTSALIISIIGILVCFYIVFCIAFSRPLIQTDYVKNTKSSLYEEEDMHPYDDYEYSENYYDFEGDEGYLGNQHITLN